MPTFIECTSLNISYDIFGLATITYTVVSDTPGVKVCNQIITPSQTFSGYVTNASVAPIPNTTWFETHVTLIATTTGAS